MADYEGLTNQDVDPVDAWEEMRDAELRLDAADEERALAAEQEQSAGTDEPDGECVPELIDGTLYGCGACEPCLSVTDDLDEDDG